MQKRLPKIRRAPELLSPHRFTERDLAILRKIADYRFLTASLLQVLISGNAKVTARHLQRCYHDGLVSRFRLSHRDEFIYYLENKKALELLVESGEADRDELDWNVIRVNREGKYHEVSEPSKLLEAVSRLTWLAHELMISRFHAALEIACRDLSGSVRLVSWQQGRARLQDRVIVRKLKRQGTAWVETDQEEVLPHEPDAFFTLGFPSESGDESQLSFFYEADRKRTSAPRFARKLRAHFAYIARRKQHREKYGVHRIRAVLTETLDNQWAMHLRESARQPAVSGSNASPLFWFTSSQVLLGNGDQPRFLADPRLILRRIWFSPVDDTPLSLLD